MNERSKLKNKSLLPVKWQERSQGEVLVLNPEETQRLIGLVEKTSFNWLGYREADFFGVCRYSGVEEGVLSSRITGTWANGQIDGMLAMSSAVQETTGCPSYIGFSILTSVRQFPMRLVHEAMEDFEVQVAPENKQVIGMLADGWSGVVGPMANMLDSLMDRRVAASMAATGCDSSTLRMHFMEIEALSDLEQVKFNVDMDLCWQRRGWKSERPSKLQTPVLRMGNNRRQLRLVG